MSSLQQVSLFLNEEQNGHESVISKLLLEAQELECMVAFAKTSGFKLIQKSLKIGLAKGLKARFAIGLSFYQTEPELLRQLLKLGKKYPLELYVSNSNATFHPKIYALTHGDGCTLLIGSANLTGGGLQGNYEASALIDDPSSALMQSVRSHMDELVEAQVLVPATEDRIKEYEHLYTINNVQQLLACRRTEKSLKRASTLAGTQLDTLREILVEMKNDTTDNGFESNKIIRRRNLKLAARNITELALMDGLKHNNFVEHYDNLIRLFNSGGLHRGKNIIAENYDKFQAALAEVIQSNKLTPRDAYQLLFKHFERIPRAGVNVLTEILHALNHKRYAVMNQNAVSGLRLANIYDFPLKPNKVNVSAEIYELFCQRAEVVRKELGLADFTELDALFNYAYWEREEEAVEVDE